MKINTGFSGLIWLRYAYKVRRSNENIGAALHRKMRKRIYVRNYRIYRKKAGQ